MGFETVLVDREGDVGVLTLNRPDKLNAISNVMAYELGEAVSQPDFKAVRGE